MGSIRIHGSAPADRRSYDPGSYCTCPTCAGDSGWTATPAISANACALDVLNLGILHWVPDICEVHPIRPLATLTQRVAQALVSNRIQEIVSPPRPGQRRHRNGDEETPYGLRSWARRVWSRVFPVDLSSTPSRTIIRLPSSYLLLKSLFTWTIIILQAFRLFPNTQTDWLHNVTARVDRLETGEVCWSTFKAVCTALCVNYITSGLEGHGRDAPPFNLVRTCDCPYSLQFD